MVVIFYTTGFWVERLNNRMRSFRLLNRLTKWFVTRSHAISHLGLWLMHCCLRVIKLQPRFKVCNISYLHALFHNFELFLTFWYINNKNIKGKECIHCYMTNLHHKLHVLFCYIHCLLFFFQFICDFWKPNFVIKWRISITRQCNRCCRWWWDSSDPTH